MPDTVGTTPAATPSMPDVEAIPDFGYGEEGWAEPPVTEPTETPSEEISEKTTEEAPEETTAETSVEGIAKPQPEKDEFAALSAEAKADIQFLQQQIRPIAEYVEETGVHPMEWIGEFQQNQEAFWRRALTVDPQTAERNIAYITGAYNQQLAPVIQQREQSAYQQGVASGGNNYIRQFFEGLARHDPVLAEQVLQASAEIAKTQPTQQATTTPLSDPRVQSLLQSYQQLQQELNSIRQQQGYGQQEQVLASYDQLEEAEVGSIINQAFEGSAVSPNLRQLVERGARADLEDTMARSPAAKRASQEFQFGNHKRAFDLWMSELRRQAPQAIKRALMAVNGSQKTARPTSKATLPRNESGKFVQAAASSEGKSEATPTQKPKNPWDLDSQDKARMRKLGFKI